MPTDEDKSIGQEAGRIARQETIAALISDDMTSPAGLVRKLKELLEATTQRSYNDNGTILYTKKLTDNTTRLGALKLLAQLLDALPAERHQLEGGGEPLRIEVVRFCDDEPAHTE